MTRGTDRVYDALVARFVPRTIHEEGDYQAALAMIDDILSRSELHAAEADYLELITQLVVAYEQRNHPVDDVRGIDVLRVLMAEHGLRQKDLIDVFKTESIASEVLSGKRELNKSQIEKLAAKFSVSPAVFFGSPQQDCVGVTAHGVDGIKLG